MLKKDADVWAKAFLNQYDVPGLALAVSQYGKTLHAEGYGYQDRESRNPASLDTIFGIASITKSFTCAAILRLQEEKKLSVHDPVIRYLPELRTPSRTHTEAMHIHHFMTHSSGIPPLPTLAYAMKRSMDLDPSVKDYSGALNVMLNEHGPIDTYDQFIAYLSNSDYKLLGPPGEQFSYSNDCFALLGAIVERVSGMSFAAYVERAILQPAQMEHTSFDLLKLPPKLLSMQYATGTDGKGGKRTNAAPGWWEAPAMPAAGFLRSTLRDMMQYMEMLRNQGVVGCRRVLNKESVKQMMFPHVRLIHGRHYGYGLHIRRTIQGNMRIEHGGGLKSISSRMVYLPECGVTGVILSNLTECPVSIVMDSILNRVQGLTPESDVYDNFAYLGRLDDPQCYCGWYTSAEGTALEFGENKKVPTLVLEGRENDLKPVIEKDVFLFNGIDGKVWFKFIRDSQGEVIRVWSSASSRQLTKQKRKIANEIKLVF